jgi:hypothetical protein
MAIKGRSKPKARRSVTPGPRPVYVPVKRSLVQRRGLQIGVLAVVVLASLTAIAYGFVRERDANHDEDQRRIMRSIVSEYTVKVQTAIAGVGQAQAVSFTLLPDLKSQIDALRSEDADAAAVAEVAKDLRARAQGAADELGRIDTSAMIRGKGVEDKLFVDQLINATIKMENGLRMDAVAAGILEQAAKAPASQVDDLLDQADEARTAAESIFQSGFSNWVSAQIAAGTFQPASLGGAP